VTALATPPGPGPARLVPPFAPSAAVRLRTAEERRRASGELTRLIGDLYRAEPRRRQTFGLAPVELRAHANALARAGWSVPEVLQVLALPKPERVSK
jgi:hypothetical protein